MSRPENRRSTAAGNEAGESGFDSITDQQTISGSHPSSANQSEAANQVAAQLAELLRTNPDALRDVLARAGQSADPIAGQVHQHPLSRFDKQKDNLVKGLGSLVEEARQMNRNLRRSEQSGIVPLFAQYGDSGVDRIEQLSEYLSGRNVTELVGEAARFAQRNATYLVPGAFMLGLLGARFLKSSTSMPAEIAGSQDAATDAALLTPPPSSGDIAGTTAGGATRDRLEQLAQTAYTPLKQHGEDEAKAFAAGANRSTLGQDDPTTLIGGQRRSS